MRLRQVRMDEVECGSIPGWMRELYGYEVECGAPYSWGGRSELPIFRPEYPECPCSMEQLTSGEYCDACSPVAPECRDGDDPASCWPACLAPCSTQRLANFSLPFTFQDSLQLFQAATCLNPHNVCNLKQVGRSLYLLGKHKAALDVYEEAQRIGIDDWEIWHNKGLCNMYLKQYEGAADCFKRANAIQRHLSLIHI